jgi:hypothetical protein
MEEEGGRGLGRPNPPRNEQKKRNSRARVVKREGSPEPELRLQQQREAEARGG